MQRPPSFPCAAMVLSLAACQPSPTEADGATAATTPELQPIECGGELSPPKVVLRWQAAERLELELENATPIAFDVELRAAVHDRGVTRERALGTVHLAEHGRDTRTVSLAGERGDGAFPGHLAVWGRIHAPDGKVIETAYADGRAFRRGADGGFAITRDDLRAQIADDPNVLSIEDHDEAAQQAAGGDR